MKPVKPIEEKIARVIARKLGHNDDTGMYWERYIEAARGIVEEFRVSELKAVA